MIESALLFFGFIGMAFAIVMFAIIGYSGFQHFLFWAQLWKRRREEREIFADSGWNIDPEQIPEGRRVVAVWEGWIPEVCRRRGDVLYSDSITFELDGCVGWVDLPEKIKRGDRK